MFYFAGLDLGQSKDYTALAIVEVVGRAHHVRHLQRFNLGTPYPDIVSSVTAMLHTEPLSSGTVLVIDHTGVGRPVFDLFTSAGLKPIGLTIVGGKTATIAQDGWRVPKGDLVGLLQVLLQTERLKFAGGLPEVENLVKELLAFQIKVSDAGNDLFGQWRNGAHDDLVLAVALACYAAEHAQGDKTKPVMPGRAAIAGATIGASKSKRGWSLR